MLATTKSTANRSQAPSMASPLHPTVTHLSAVNSGSVGWTIVPACFLLIWLKLHCWKKPVWQGKLLMDFVQCVQETRLWKCQPRDIIYFHWILHRKFFIGLLLLLNTQTSAHVPRKDCLFSSNMCYPGMYCKYIGWRVWQISEVCQAGGKTAHLFVVDCLRSWKKGTLILWMLQYWQLPGPWVLRTVYSCFLTPLFGIVIFCREE